MKCSSEISLYSSIDFIISKIREIEYLKYILLDTQQLLSFSYLSKMNIYVNDSNHIHNKLNSYTQTIHYIENMNHEEKRKVLEDYFLDTDNKNVINEKLVDLIEFVK